MSFTVCLWEETHVKKEWPLFNKTMISIFSCFVFFFKNELQWDMAGLISSLNHLRNCAQSINCFVQWAGSDYVCTSYTILTKLEQRTKEISDLSSRINLLVPQTYAWCVNLVPGDTYQKSWFVFCIRMSACLGILRKVVAWDAHAGTEVKFVQFYFPLNSFLWCNKDIWSWCPAGITIKSQSPPAPPTPPCSHL